MSTPPSSSARTASPPRACTPPTTRPLAPARCACGSTASRSPPTTSPTRPSAMPCTTGSSSRAAKKAGASCRCGASAAWCSRCTRAWRSASACTATGRWRAAPCCSRSGCRRRGFADGAPHRAAARRLQPVPALRADPFYTRRHRRPAGLLRPLFTTSWLIDDFLADNGFFGAKRVLLSSASSKTAYGTAFQLRSAPGIEVVGLTSAANRAFCEEPGLLRPRAGLRRAGPAGRHALRLRRLRRQRAAAPRRARALRRTCATAAPSAARTSPQLGKAGQPARPASRRCSSRPAQIKKRQQDWGGPELQQRW
jgi:hypothetical protein